MLPESVLLPLDDPEPASELDPLEPDMPPDEPDSDEGGVPYPPDSEPDDEPLPDPIDDEPLEPDDPEPMSDDDDPLDPGVVPYPAEPPMLELPLRACIWLWRSAIRCTACCRVDTFWSCCVVNTRAAPLGVSSSLTVVFGMAAGHVAPVLEPDWLEEPYLIVCPACGCC